MGQHRGDQVGGLRLSVERKLEQHAPAVEVLCQMHEGVVDETHRAPRDGHRPILLSRNDARAREFRMNKLPNPLCWVSSTTAKPLVVSVSRDSIRLMNGHFSQGEQDEMTTLLRQTNHRAAIVQRGLDEGLSFQQIADEMG